MLCISALQVIIVVPCIYMLLRFLRHPKHFSYTHGEHVYVSGELLLLLVALGLWGVWSYLGL